MIGNFITVQQVYDYAVAHNYLKADIYTVLRIINGDKDTHNRTDSKSINPVNDSSTVDFSDLVEYTVEDLMTLLSI